MAALSGVMKRCLAEAVGTVHIGASRNEDVGRIDVPIVARALERAVAVSIQGVWVCVVRQKEFNNLHVVTCSCPMNRSDSVCVRCVRPTDIYRNHRFDGFEVAPSACSFHLRTRLSLHDRMFILIMQFQMFDAQRKEGTFRYCS